MTPLRKRMAPVAVFLVVMLATASAIPILPPLGEDGGDNDQAAADMRFKQAPASDPASVDDTVPQEGDIPAAELQEPDDPADLDDGSDPDNPDMTYHDASKDAHTVSPRFAQAHMERAHTVASSPSMVSIPAKQFRAQTKKSLGMLDGMVNQLNKMSSTLTGKISGGAMKAAVTPQQTTAPTQQTSAPQGNSTNSTKPPNNATNATNPRPPTNATNTTKPGNATNPVNNATKINGTIVNGTKVNGTKVNGTKVNVNTTKLLQDLTQNATKNQTANQTKPIQQSQNKTVTPQVPSTPGQNKLSSSACYKWIPTKGRQHDERQGAFSWLSKDGKQAYLIGGCDGMNHVKGCASTVQILDLTAKKPENEQVWDANAIDYKGDMQMKGRSIMYAHDRKTDTVYDFGGTRDKGSAGMKMVNTLGQLRRDKGSGRWKWSVITVKNAPTDSANIPPAFEDGTLVVARDALILFGGFNRKSFSNTLYYMNIGDPASPTTYQWRKVVPRGTPPSPRSGHSATVVGDRMYVVGGTNAKGVLNDVHELLLPDNMDTGTWEWKLVETKGSPNAPSPRAFHSATLMPGQLLFVIGGLNTFKREMYNDVKILSLSSKTWVAVPDTFSKNFIVPKFRKASILPVGKARSRILVFGGCMQDKCNNVFAPLIFDTDAVCATSCKHGKYEEAGKLKIPGCKCESGWKGKFCDTNAKCPNDCSDRGRCVEGKCQCKLGFGGEDCSKPVCPNDCSGDRGDCSLSEKRCICKIGNWGLDCSQDRCPKDCYGRGICQAVDKKKDPRKKNWCKCLPGFSGNACQNWGFHNQVLNVTHAAQQRNISKGGEVVKGKNTTYDMGFTCPGHCSGHGICKKVVTELGVVGGKCECRPGFGGADCAGECSLHCTNTLHGTCSGIDSSRVKCKCNEGFRGVGCYKQYCARNCSNHGVCQRDKCFCTAPWSGAACEMDTSCNGGKGKYLDGKCNCKAGFGGASCQQEVKCPNGCGDNGACFGKPLLPGQTKTSGGYCKCKPGFRGERCEKRECPNKCSHNGVCTDTGVCKCYSGFTRADCSLRVQCPQNCTGTHGSCIPNANDPTVGHCQCTEKWAGPACNDLGCKKACYQRGKCTEGKCLCDPGYSGEMCEFMCPKKCSGHGDCIQEQCKCHPGYSGPDCNKTSTCPGFGKALGECSGKGECHRPTGRCYCHPDRTGEDCSREKECAGGKGKPGCLHGSCVNGKCFCNPGWSGENCEVKASCQNDCSNRGICQNGKCFCFTGFTGPACETYANDFTCPKNCTGNGVCQYSRCHCLEGYTGADCSVESQEKCRRFAHSAFVCEGRGLCRASKCFCHPGFAGEFCHHGEMCPKGCVAGQGICFNKKCHCNPGFKGEDCSEDLVCPGTPLPCSNHGVCISGRCGCIPGYRGADCSILDAGKNLTCPNNCSSAGVCQLGQCFCMPGRTGKDCSHKEQGSCPLNCGGPERGSCRLGECVCNAGYAGPACQKKLECPANCLQNGVCTYGKCFCSPGWKGESCQIREDQGTTREALENDIERAYQDLIKRGVVNNTCAGCNMHGVCLRGRCLCEPPYYGKFCERLAKGPLSQRCPNNCNKHGQCLFGKCLCELGYHGKACELKETLPCPSNCNGNGICHHGKCACKVGFGGDSCALKHSAGCNPPCNPAHGVCQNKKCVCEAAWGGPTCNVSAVTENNRKVKAPAAKQTANATQTAKQAPPAQKPTSSAASAMKFREKGDVPDISAILGMSHCENDCSPNGVCLNEQCYCKQGFSGPDCSTKQDELPPPHISQIQNPTPVATKEAATLGAAVQPVKTSMSVHVLFAFIGFCVGVIACLAIQAGYNNYKSAQKKAVRQNILKPLISSMDNH